MPMFMKLGDIESESRDARFPGWFRLETFAFGRLEVQQAGSGSLRRKVSEIHVTVPEDTAILEVHHACVVGLMFDSVTIVTNSGGSMELKEGLISDLILSANADRRQASFVLDFKSISHSPSYVPAAPAVPKRKAKRPASRRR